MRNLFKPFIAQSEVDDLYNGTLIPRKYRHVELSGTDVIKRGTPLASDDGETFTVWEPGKVIRGILIFDIDTDEIEEARNAPIGVSGEFNQNKLEEALDDPLTPLAVMVAWGDHIHIEPSRAYPPVDYHPLG